MSYHLSKEFIEAQRKRLEEDRAVVVRNIEQLKQDDPFADPDYSNDNAAVDNDVREQAGHMTIEAEISVLEKRLRDIDAALEKISKGTYGIDEKTGEPIPQSRLEVVPEARFNVSTE